MKDHFTASLKMSDDLDAHGMTQNVESNSILAD